MISIRRIWRNIMNQSSDMNNFYFPFEGGRHQGTIIELPYRADTWRNKAKEARPVFLELVKNMRWFIYYVTRKLMRKS